MQQIQGPATVLVTALNDHLDGLADAVVGFNACTPEIIETAQNVVVPKRWEGEAEPALVDNFTAAKRAEHLALKQIAFGPLSRLADGRRFASCAFVGQQSFEHADGGMKRRAPAFGSFAVPAAIFQLLVQQLIRESVVGCFEIRAEGEDSPVNTWFGFAVKETAVAVPLKNEMLVDTINHFAGLLAAGV